ncbi:hypothetical protein ABT061_09295 [Streptosporangium sp. NPDC002544]|uniref:hypothetical protein n=1 Tax=Streptosporangium sp. NPDC002544 TaxID=3154538 RepID=UPI003320D30C
MLSKNYRYIKIYSLAACIILTSFGTAGCGDQFAREKQCIAAANKDAEELKKATTALLPPDISETVVENNSCDSGADGVYLTFHADRSISIDQILRKFRAQGWGTIDPPSKDCIACIAQISKEVNGRSAHLSIMDRQLSRAFEIVVLYR